MGCSAGGQKLLQEKRSAVERNEVLESDRRAQAARRWGIEDTTMHVTSTAPSQQLTRSGMRRRVVVIGNFDGLHRGHRALLETARTWAGSVGEVAVLTFWPPPARVLAAATAPPLLTSRTRKWELLAEAGVDRLIELPFDRALAEWSAERFIQELLLEKLDAAAVCVGYDFSFGKGRSGNTTLLRDRLQAAERAVLIVPAVGTADGGDATQLLCSSTAVRRLVQAGEVGQARRMLGRDMDCEGRVIHGQKRGRDLGYPTANLSMEAGLLIPGEGIYAGWAHVLSEAAVAPASGVFLARRAGRRYAAAISVGRNVTFAPMTQDPQGLGSPPLSVEVHLITDPSDGWLDLYGQDLRVGFAERLRGEVRFDSIPALVQQIAQDVEASRGLAERTWQVQGREPLRHPENGRGDGA